VPFTDVFFIEDKFPRLDTIVGFAEIGDVRIQLPGAEQQQLSDEVPSELAPQLPADELPARSPDTAADGPPSQRTRSRLRSAEAVAAAVEGDTTGLFGVEGGIHCMHLATADGDPAVPVWIDTDAMQGFDLNATLTDAASGVPQSTSEALGGGRLIGLHASSG